MATEHEHKRELLSIHEQRVDLWNKKAKQYGGKENMPIHNQMELEDDERQIRELRDWLKNNE